MADAWPPTTSAQLEAAIANGLLVESHFVDLKREIPAAPKNQKTAVDLAAFSVDGGVLFVGIDEATSPPSVSPVPLSGLAERIEQIGLSTVDPPVRIRTTEIEVSPESGVLLVIVPPSPFAPHMVDGQYRARGDKTNYVMNDAEVTRVRAQRLDDRDDIEEMLKQFAESAMRKMGSGPLLLAVARPVGGRTDLLLKCAGPDPFGWIERVLVRGPLSRRLSEGWSPDFLDGLPVEPRANGWSITRNRLDLEIHEDGVLRLRSGDLEYTVMNDERTVNDMAINGLVKRIVMSAAELGAECSHFGTWEFAVSIVPLLNRRAESARRRLVTPMPPYSEQVYWESASATYEELRAEPNAVVDRLLGRLNRSFGGAAAVIP
jgi:hypothetical protein